MGAEKGAWDKVAQKGADAAKRNGVRLYFRTSFNHKIKFPGFWPWNPSTYFWKQYGWMIYDARGILENFKTTAPKLQADRMHVTVPANVFLVQEMVKRLVS